MQLGVDWRTLNARQALSLRYSMLIGPFTEPRDIERLRETLDWPTTREEWGTTPEALAAQDALLRSLGEEV